MADGHAHETGITGCKSGSGSNAACVCECGHEHTAGRFGSCSKFTCPCNEWRAPEEERDVDVSPRPESTQSEGVAEGADTDSRSSSGDHLDAYREGFADGLRWVLGNVELTPEDEDRIEEALDG